MRNTSKSALLFLHMLASSACDALPAGDDNPQKPGELQQVAQPLGDGFRNVRNGKAAFAWDGGHFLAVWEALDASGVRQLAGQLFDFTGLALTPSRLLTRGTRGSSTPVVTLRPGAPGFFVMYSNQYSSSDQDIRGMFLRSDATVERDFSIDFSSASDWATAATVTSPVSNQIYVVYMRGGWPVGQLRAAYIETDGSVTGMSAPVPPNDPGAGPAWLPSPKVVLGANNSMALAWALNPSGDVRLAYVTVGATSISAPSNAIAVTDGADISLAYNPGVSRFLVAYSGGNPNGIVARTFASGCPSPGCMSSGKTVLNRLTDSPHWWNFAARPVGSSFVVAGIVIDSDRLETVQVSAGGSPGTVQVETLSPHALNSSVVAATTIDQLPAALFGIVRDDGGPTLVAKRYTETGTLAATTTVAD
jgi:hypothetical protein